MQLTTSHFFDTSAFSHKDIFPDHAPPWQPLHMLKSYMHDQDYPATMEDLASSPGPLGRTIVLLHDSLLPQKECRIEYGDATRGDLKVYHRGAVLEGASVVMAGAVLSGTRIRLGRGVLVESGAFIKGPAIIGDRSEVRQGAYLRGYCLVGDRCVVGHVTEAKHSILLDDAKAGHFAYLGDSILGNHVNLGAGTKLANLRFTGGEVRVATPTGPVATGLRKLGAILGDRVQTGCNSVTNPGTLLGKKAILMPNTTAPSGLHGAGTLIRSQRA